MPKRKARDGGGGGGGGRDAKRPASSNLLEANKSLGQNFLKNPAIVDAIVDRAEIRATDCVLEVGPGTPRRADSLLVGSDFATYFERTTRILRGDGSRRRRGDDADSARVAAAPRRRRG